MIVHPFARALALSALALSASGCLFFNDPNNKASNNIRTSCQGITCDLGEECDSDEGGCVAIECTFTNDEEDFPFRSNCPPGTVCHLDNDGFGYCDAPCTFDQGCSGDTYCDLKYDQALGLNAGICLGNDVNVVNCDVFDGLCLFTEYCDPNTSACVPDVPVECFNRPLDQDNECMLQPCDFSGGDPDGVCDLGVDIPTTCHYRPDAPDNVQLDGYCFYDCFSDDDCVGDAICESDTGTCIPDDVGIEPVCEPWELIGPNGKCVPAPCNRPNDPMGDVQCRRLDPGGAELFCGDPPNANINGICWPDCTSFDEDEEACASTILVCNRDTKRCELRQN